MYEGMCKKTGKYQLLFSFYEKLAAVLADKADLGMCIKSAYRFIQEIRTILTEWFWFPFLLLQISYNCNIEFLYQDTVGGQISVDGKNWVDEADYEKNNAAPDVQWWTADEYEAWMNEQKKEMESLIGTGDGWYDGEGVFHEFTQESVAAMMDSYKGTLESIKKGVLYSKDNGDGDTYSMIPPTEDVVSSYSVDVTKDNGKTVHIGDYSTVEELDKAISDAVKNGQLTQEEADAVHQ